MEVLQISKYCMKSRIRYIMCSHALFPYLPLAPRALVFHMPFTLRALVLYAFQLSCFFIYLFIYLYLTNNLTVYNLLKKGRLAIHKIKIVRLIKDGFSARMT